MKVKRRRGEEDVGQPRRAPKRPRLPERPDPSTPSNDGLDRLTTLSDELILRVLSFLPLPSLLHVSPVSRRLHQLSSDSSLWRALYYSRFVLPRALQIPGFRDGVARDGKLHYSSRRAVWADGRSGGLVASLRNADTEKDKDKDKDKDHRGALCWKRQYKLRHNWSRGRCAVEELLVASQDCPSFVPQASGSSGTERRTLVKVADGLAITADLASGLRAWDLRTRQMVAQISLRDTRGKRAVPTALAVDQQCPSGNSLDIVVGFVDGAFGVWRLDISEKSIIRRYRQDKAGAGELVDVAISYPFLLIATESVQISLYAFVRPVEGRPPHAQAPPDSSDTECGSVSDSETETGSRSGRTEGNAGNSHVSEIPTLLRPPHLITCLKSHTSRAPLALSIRRVAGTVVASVAYTFTALQGWSVGIQDLIVDISAMPAGTLPKVVTSRVAYTDPVNSGIQRLASAIPSAGTGPTTLCYSHPYLLVTLPDNTLFLHLCISMSSSLSIGPGIRLFGHTSGIGDAEITARGKAVSVSRHGEEILVWELEGKMPRERTAVQLAPSVSTGPSEEAWDARRNWVGFDDEMVIVLKEAGGGRESLVVYDFT